MAKVYDALLRAESRRSQSDGANLPATSISRSGFDLDPPFERSVAAEEDELVERIASLEVSICALYDRLDAELPETTASLDARLDLAVASVHRLLDLQRQSIENQIHLSSRRLGKFTAALGFAVLIGFAALRITQI
jgi:hypothetical protein